MIVNDSLLKKYDKSDMFTLLKNFPKHCFEGYNFPLPEIGKNFEKIIFTGMGGSAIAGDIIKVLIEDTTEIPVFVIRDYSLPKYVDFKTLVIAESYSGNTEETISSYKIANEKKCLIICISSNGEIEKIANLNHNLFIKIPSGMPPRCAFGYLFFPVYKFFVQMNILPPLEKKFFEKIEKWVNDFSLYSKNNKAVEIANKIHKNILLLYSENRFYPGILRWKTQIAENSKSFSFINVLPEMNHNEIMSFYFPKLLLKRLIVLFIISGIENERIKKRIEITSNIISQKVKEVLKLNIEGETLLEKLIYLIILGDWVSYYLAILNKVDPTEIEEIKILKEEMKKGEN
ncbi:MAG: bifunctional phosphoglucose/phosphomannose isomerase [Candidatus Omnitrophica bacterium]|nr:bifunctional phosphoglucose/phosphomannose isomerase [Candidatus Omnitrophota bacterium]MCM8808858.1 bifunctional phosphoglucose/phosphomannose isomerase [Candidatus Omnitrophota bacterium]MCM8810799.1 bifunctional phosphoglucose/phosphomannose isomerase [Candidatus Omnitrophota bacterium]